MTEIKMIKPEELAKLHEEKGIHLIDVRTPAEFRELHTPIAVNIPLDTLNAEEIKQLQNGNGGRSDLRHLPKRKSIHTGLPEIDRSWCHKCGQRRRGNHRLGSTGGSR